MTNISVAQMPVRELKSHCMMLPITPECLQEIDASITSRAYLLPGQLPEDVEFCGMIFNVWMHRFEIKMYSPAFAPIPEGGAYPAIEVYFERQKDPDAPPCPFLTKLATFLRDAKASIETPGSKIALKDVVIWPALYQQGNENR